MADDAVLHHLPDAKLLGKADIYYFFWHIYEARLYTNGSFSFEKPFILTLHYQRPIDGSNIAKVSAEKIRELGFSDEVALAAWYSQMKEIFPDVQKGSELTGVYQPDNPTLFYQNGRVLGSIRDAEFGKWFFGIWLDKKTEKPLMRKALLGEVR